MKHGGVLPDVLLLPGLLCDERLWAAQTAALADSARSRTSDLTAHESIAAMADAVLSQAPGRFAMAGFSMGGCVALEVAARAPDRVGRLALLSTSARGLSPPVRQQLRTRSPASRPTGSTPTLQMLSPLRGPRTDTRPCAVGSLRRYGQESRPGRRRPADTGAA